VSVNAETVPTIRLDNIHKTYDLREFQVRALGGVLSDILPRINFFCVQSCGELSPQ